jgi:hypothetical protein
MGRGDAGAVVRAAQEAMAEALNEMHIQGRIVSGGFEDDPAHVLGISDAPSGRVVETLEPKPPSLIRGQPQEMLFPKSCR